MATTVLETTKDKWIPNESAQALLKCIKPYKLLSAEEEKDLVIRAKGGDVLAKHQLIHANMRFVVSVAKTYQGHGLPMEDLIVAGTIGMLKAIVKYDPTRSIKLISFAVYYIRYSIFVELQNFGSIIRKPMDEYKDFENHSTIISMDAPLADSDDLRYEDTFTSYLPSSDDPLIKESLKADLSRCLKCLTNRERHVIESFYFHDLSLTAIAFRLKITKEGAQYILDKAMGKLRTKPCKQLLRQYRNCA